MRQLNARTAYLEDQQKNWFKRTFEEAWHGMVTGHWTANDG